MSVKQQVLELLLKHPQTFLSGQDMANTLGVSRNAVWKAIKQLQSQGYSIDSDVQHGYQLVQASSQLDVAQIQSDTTAHWHIEVHNSVTSTNDLAKSYASTHPSQSALFVATQQTKGRGRYGRTFHSNLEEGLYFSVLLRPSPELNLADIPQYTLMAASAIAQVLEPYVEDSIQIKWINDLFYQQRKVGGILCEAISDIETQSISAIIIGIGLNLAGDFTHTDSQTQQVAGTLFASLPSNFNRNTILQDFLAQLMHYEQHFHEKLHLPHYRQHLLGIGKTVSYTQQDQQFQGRIDGINDEGHLLVTQSDGTQVALFSHDIHFSSSQFI